MTAKQFFKSVAFKCIVTLLCVLLISGVFLTIMNGFLEVTDEEKFARKVGNLYTDGSSVNPEEDKELEPVKVGSSTIEKLWIIPEKQDYLIQVSGTGRDGKIVTWVIVDMDKDYKTINGIGTVLVYEKVASEYADKISGWNTNIENFSKDYKEGIVYKYGTAGDSMYINTGASVSFTTICNCVNDAIEFAAAYASGGSIGGSPYDGFLYTDIINQKETEVTFADGKMTYKVVTMPYGGVTNPFTIEIVVNAEKKIESFSYVGEKGNGSTYGYDKMMPDMETMLAGKDLSYFTGLYGEDMEYTPMASYDDTSITAGATTSSSKIGSKSIYVCMYAGAFATANYENALKLGIKYTDVLDMDATTWTVGDDGKVTYTVKTLAYGGVTTPFTFEIVVDGDKKIESFDITVNGSTYGYDKMMPDMETMLAGKDLSYFTGLYGEDMEYTPMASYDDTSITAGATTSSSKIGSKSIYVCMYAGAFATANSELATLIGGNTNE